MSQTQSKLEKKGQVQDEMPEEPGRLIVFDLRRLAHFQEERPDVQVLSDIGAARLVLFTFKAGQQLQEHRTSSQILVQALRGRVIFTAAGSSVKLQAGMVLQLEANVPHTVEAQTDAVMLVTMTPSPASHSLEREVFANLTPLVTRTARASEEAGGMAAAESGGAVAEGVEHQEVSHVFHCMQCDLEFQMDLAIARNPGSQGIDAGVVRVRMDPRIRLERADQHSTSSE